MPPLDNPKHEQFAQSVAAGMSQTAAAITAGYAESRGRATGSQLAKQGDIAQRIAELRGMMLARSAETASYSLAQALKRANVAYDVAHKRKNAAAMVAAVTLEAKLTGILVEKRQDVRNLDEYSDDEIDRMLASREAERAAASAVATSELSADSGTPAQSEA